jgi:LmbE family N-acetylglucosaminyl deacetylase
MKLRIFFRPALPVGLLGAVAVLFWVAFVVLGGQGLALVMLPFAAFYSVLFALAGVALIRLGHLEQWRSWEAAGRLLILAPHEDDCVISAGGIASANQRLGGTTRIVYLARDENPGLPERRAKEARAAWKNIGLGADDMSHLDLLPLLMHRDPQKLRVAAGVLRGIIDEFRPTTVVVPMFEGGHVQHDQTAALVGLILKPDDRFEVFEAPEYSPYTSLWNTPHRIVALCSRWLFGLVSYYGLPDGIDARPVQCCRLDPADLASKRHMLAAFESQNAPSLVETKSYPDRLVPLERKAIRGMPFDFQWSYLRLVLALRGWLPAGLVDRLLPVQLGTIGREGGITDWATEWEAPGTPSDTSRTSGPGR